MEVSNPFSNPGQGYFLSFYRQLPKESPPHRFGGANRWKESDCPHCHRPFQNLMELSVRDRRLKLKSTGLSSLPLCFCIGCSSFVKGLDYGVTPKREMILIEPGEHDLPFDPPMGNFHEEIDDHPFVLHPIPERIHEARLLAAEGRLDEAGDWVKRFDWQTPTHQVGGIPVGWRPGLESPDCPGCQRVMPWLAGVAARIDENTIVLPEPGQQVWFWFCRRCLIVHAQLIEPV